ncbi:kinase-like protein [Dacryopinax primogenitus]|uniref:Kinase-like protein n=1 Tax=Dacryopinax primogenitus (strain DJM 731) TaxID=1858805 RepID=M5G4Z5_DACPD|nr:kinase-like protein [Dacryopinax primogenitus]EJU03724.1 kinase-like protein [Dacryopinax primogenitus]
MSGTTRGTAVVDNPVLSEQEFQNLIEALQAPRVQVTSWEKEPRGHGHYAAVYTGRAVVQSREVSVALKVFHRRDSPEDVARLTRNLIRETRVWSHLRHPNVLTLHGVYPEVRSRRVWLVSPWIENGNLSQYLNVYPRADCIALCRGILSGVIYLHSKNVLQEDIRATNVLVGVDSVPLLADFGLSRFLEELPPTVEATTGMYSGSLRWMAPERIQPATFGLTTTSAQSAASDVYSVGMTMYEIFARKAPFHLKRDVEVIQAVVSGERMDHPGNNAIMRGMTPRIWEFMWDTWDADRTKRPKLETALETILCDGPFEGTTRSELRGVTRQAYNRRHWLEIDLVASEPVYELERWKDGFYLGRKERGEKGIFPGYLIYLEDQSTSRQGPAYEPRVSNAVGVRPQPVQRSTIQVPAPDPYDIGRINIGPSRTSTLSMGPYPTTSVMSAAPAQYLYEEPLDMNTRLATPPDDDETDNEGFVPRLDAPLLAASRLPQQSGYRTHPYTAFPPPTVEEREEADQSRPSVVSPQGPRLQGGYANNPSQAQLPASQFAPPPYPPPGVPAKRNQQLRAVPNETRSEYVRTLDPDPRAPVPPPRIAGGYTQRPAPANPAHQSMVEIATRETELRADMLQNQPMQPNYPLNARPTAQDIDILYKIKNYFNVGNASAYSANQPVRTVRNVPVAQPAYQTRPDATYAVTTSNSNRLPGTARRTQTAAAPSSQPAYPPRPALDQRQSYGPPPTNAPGPGFMPITQGAPLQPVPQDGQTRLLNPHAPRQQHNREIDEVTGYMQSMTIQRPAPGGPQQPAYWRAPQPR